jgi:anti-sigma regulatory factor (Ser/Thr protein kinase)
VKRSTPRTFRPRRTLAAEAAATADGLTALLDAFNRFAGRHHLAERARHEMYIALDEVLSNKVKHRRPRGGRMSLALLLTEGAVRATIRDNGAAFDPLTAPRPNTETPLLDRPIGGLGLLFVSELMDDVRYERQGAWNCLVMTKRLS